MKFGDPRNGVAAGGEPGFCDPFFVVDGALLGGGGSFFGVGGAVVGLVVVGALVVGDGGGLPAVVCARARLEICGATQTAALAARPALTVVCANFRRVNSPARSPSLAMPSGTFGSVNQTDKGLVKLGGRNPPASPDRLSPLTFTRRLAAVASIPVEGAASQRRGPQSKTPPEGVKKRPPRGHAVASAALAIFECAGPVQPRCWPGSPLPGSAHSARDKRTLSASAALLRRRPHVAPRLHPIGRPNAAIRGHSPAACLRSRAHAEVNRTRAPNCRSVLVTSSNALGCHERP